jgi:Bacterial Ig-like domain
MKARWRTLTIFAGLCVAMLALGSMASAEEVDTTPPTVIETVPYEGKTRVRLDKVILAYFAEPDAHSMDRASINTSTFRLHEGGYDPATSTCEASCSVPAVVKYRSGWGKAVLDPNELLKPSTLYTVVIEGASGDTNGGALAVRDLAGNPMTQTYTFTFTTMR